MNNKETKNLTSNFLKNFIKRKSVGFGMLDLLLWIVMVGILITIMAPSIRYGMRKVKIFATERILDKIDFALTQYSLEMGDFPTRRDGGLTALVSRPQSNPQDWKGPYLPDGIKMEGDANSGIEIKDQWGNAIEYNIPPVNFPNRYRKYELISYGPNEEDQSGYLSRGQ